MIRALWTGVFLAGTACGRSPSTEPSGDPASAPPDRAAGAKTQAGLVGAGMLTASGVLLGIIDDPPRVWLHSAAGDRSWVAPARIGALASGAKPAEVVVAAAWPEARVPSAEVWWLVEGVAQRHCSWKAPPAERWRAQPRGASSVLALSDGAVVTGVDGSLVQFDASCRATVLHAEGCCEDERPLRLRGDARAWAAIDLGGQRVYPAGNDGGAAVCVPVLDGATVRGNGWRAQLPTEQRDVRVLDWSESCDAVLLAAGARAWVCRTSGCARVR
jgi:hypothetical protein